MRSCTFVRFPAFNDYLPPKGVLSPELFTYRRPDELRGRRVAAGAVRDQLRGRAGTLRSAFGRFHVAQYRDPLSQFGSFVRAWSTSWGFGYPVQNWPPAAPSALSPGARSLAHPRFALADCEPRAVQAKTPAIMRKSRRGKTIEAVPLAHVFRVLNNLAAISYSDMTLDIDKAHDDTDYRASIIDKLAADRHGPRPRRHQKFDRYYEFRSFDVEAVCNQVVRRSEFIDDGRLDAALRTSGHNRL